MAKDVTLTFHGAAGTVTGSCMEFTLNGRSILVDCGLFQGSRSLETLNHRPFDFAPDRIEAVLLTHAHIDHCGLLPKLVAQGFDGPIWCTDATADLLPVMLADSGRIQEMETERHNRRRDRAGEERFEPLYTEQDALRAGEQARPVPMAEWFEPAPGFRARLWNAGHILGSASIELEANGTRIFCSGDLGPDNKAFQPDPDGPTGSDHVICESTYGNRSRKHMTIAQRRDRLEQEIKEAIGRGGNLIIPVFALERTQELLLDIAMLADAGRIPNVPVFVDSPLASRTTEVFARHADTLEDINGTDIFHHPSIHYVEDVAHSIRLNSVSGAIIMAASGMCEAGRIRHHLKHNLFRRESTVLFVGFQAQGSLGRVILEGAERVRISGEDITVRAQIRRIDSYSAHADRDELLEWIAARKPIRGSLILSHGESESRQALADGAQAQDPSLSIEMPQIGESYTLAPGTAARRLNTGRADIAQMTGTDWQNDYADFATSLKRRLNRIENEEKRKKAIAEMRRVLDSYTAFREERKARNHR